MSYVMSLSPDSSNLTGQDALAMVRAGSNGYAWGDSEYLVGVDGDNTADGRTTWDNNLSDGFDTSNIPVQIESSGAGTTMGIRGETVSDGDAAVTSIDHVDLRALVTSAGSEAIWSNLVVRFYKNGQLTETDNVSTLDAAGTSSAPSQEDLAVVTPATSGNDDVIITGSVRLISTGNCVPTTDQMFCQALIYSA